MDARPSSDAMRIARGIVGGAMLLVAAAGWAAPGSSLTAAPTVATGCEPTSARTVPQPTQAELDAAGLGDLPLAPDSRRRDLVAAPFSDPTSITNPLFPISDLDSAILNGHVDGQVFHTETTLLPTTAIVEWTPGQCVRVLESQYMAFLGGRLQETAVDLYAQADDGSVWYLGETVSDYARNGLITSTEGTWQAGVDGPFAMIMPSDPQVGDVNRAENIPGNSFEEVQVSKIDQTFDGPSGPVSGGIVAREIHQDAPPSNKLFAPGYGEFLSRDGKDVEAMALASPTDSLPGGTPRELSIIATGADRLFGSPLATPGEWRRAETVSMGVADAWAAFRTGDVPPRLVAPTQIAIRRLLDAVTAHDRMATYATSIDAAYAGNDLQLRYRPVAEIDARRFELWARRAQVDAMGRSVGGVRSDEVTLQWIRDRIAHTLDPVELVRLDTKLGRLGTAVEDHDLGAAVRTARALERLVDASIRSAGQPGRPEARPASRRAPAGS